MKANHHGLTGRGLGWLFQQVCGGSFAVAYEDGTIDHYGDGAPQFTVRFHDDPWDFWSNDVSMSFGEAYMNGCGG